MRDIQATLANSSSIGVMQTQDGIAVGLKRGQRTHSVVSANSMTKRTRYTREHARLNHNVTISKRPNSNIEYGHAAPLVLRCLRTALSAAGRRTAETPKTNAKGRKERGQTNNLSYSTAQSRACATGQRVVHEHAVDAVRCFHFAA